MTEDELYELMDEYEERFDDVFPLMCTKGMGDMEIAEAIRACLESGEPFELPAGDGVLY